jgi:hypothetical protein
VTACRWLVAVVLASGSVGCYRAVYRNLEPSGPTMAQRANVRRSSGWRSFFLYGWVPNEVRVNAAAECGSASNVREIRTRRTLNQGLVGAFASSSGVNVYSPWTGEVVCGAPELPSKPPRTDSASR